MTGIEMGSSKVFVPLIGISGSRWHRELTSQVPVIQKTSAEKKMEFPTDLSPFLRNSDLMQFYPNDELHGDDANWWVPTIECLRLKFESCGFMWSLRLTGQIGRRSEPIPSSLRHTFGIDVSRLERV